MKGKHLVPVLSLVVLLCVAGAFAAVLEVGPGKTYTAIGDAITAAADGDTIQVFPGSYREYVNVGAKSGLKLYGPNKDIDPYKQTRGPEAIILMTNPITPSMVNLGNTAATPNTEFNGFLVDGEYTFGGQRFLYAGQDDIVTCNKFQNLDGNGLYITGANCLFTRNWIDKVVNMGASAGNTAVNIGGGAAGAPVVISYNTITNINYSGLQMNGSYIDMLGNIIQNTGRHGINIGSNSKFVRAIGNNISNVNFQDNRTDEDTGGIRTYCNPPFSNSDIEIAYNTVENAMNGLHFRGSYCNETRPEFISVAAGCGPYSAGGYSFPGVAYGEYQHPTAIPPNMNVHDNNFINCVMWGLHCPRPIEPGDDGYAEPVEILDAQNNYIAGNGLGDSATTATENNNPAPEIIIADSDGDGIPDWEEIVVYGTDPNDPDQDGDGMDDGLQIALGGDPVTSTPAPLPHPGAGDADGDGYLDEYEALVGTDWTDPNDFPTLGDVNKNRIIDNGDAAIVFNLLLGKISPFGFDITRMDTNQDGIVNNLDTNILFNKFLGKPGYEYLPYNP